MFIELTDHLRCPADHPESFLVLVPDKSEGRSVLEGLLGCPVCHREYRIMGGVADFGVPALAATTSSDSTLVPALAAFLGLAGPGGYVGVIGEAAGLAGALSEAIPGVHLAAVNAPSGTMASPDVSLLRSPRSPFKVRALRGVVLSQPYSADAAWQSEAIGSVLPGLRVVGQGSAPDGVELLAQGAGWWVGRGR